MEINVATADELRNTLASFGNEFVFRGQVKHYSDAQCKTLLTTSFARSGCIPELMLKWTQYVQDMIIALCGPGSTESSDALMQSVLQHYGWRSFYIDATTDTAVAAWFATHRFSQRHRWQICEDCFGDPIMVGIQEAKYEPATEKDGHIYVISKKNLADLEIGLYDLSTEIVATERLRFHAQRACLIGPISNHLPDTCIAAHIRAPATLMREFAVMAGFQNAKDLFPPREEDPILGTLLRTPWQILPAEIGSIPFATRTLPLPEYDARFIKHRAPFDAFYSGDLIDLSQVPGDSPLHSALRIELPESILYGTHSSAMLQFPKLTTLLKKHRMLLLEAKGIYRYPEHQDKTNYVKGLALTLEPDGVVVSALVIECVGLQVGGCGVDMGWRYRIDDDGYWIRTPSASDCSCNAPHRHTRHLGVLQRAEEFISRI